MTRSIALALSGLLLYAGLAPAQYFPRSREAPRKPQRLINSRYVDQEPPPVPMSPRPSGSVPSLAGNEGPVTKESDFYPLAFIHRVFVEQLGREPSDAEAKYWMGRMNYQSRDEIANAIRIRRPATWPGHYDPRLGRFPGDPDYPDPAGYNFRDPGGPYFRSPYLPNYEFRRAIWAFPTRAQG